MRPRSIELGFALCVLVGCAVDKTPLAEVNLRLPPADGKLDYQLGSPYPPPADVVVLVRDRKASPVPGLYNICYVNGFQTQPDEETFWLTTYPDLLLRDDDGSPIIDPQWNEILVDITTPEKRAALAEIVGTWIDGCGDAGFDAVEVDNLDSYLRSRGQVSRDDAVSFMRMLSDRAHARELPIAQKNASDLLARRRDMTTDFAVVEECNRYRECDEYTAVYRDQVYVIEYDRTHFETGCRDFPGLSTVLRDLRLRDPQASEYVYDDC